ncbi:MAG: DUF924 domain-containing protein [Deltaproteobacteria bacterium]|nr:DUF924 domain-containing protein [Deltaproteobacteria bacterium]
MTESTPHDVVLEFWFGLDPARWWKKDPAFDAEVRSRFADLHAAVERGEHEGWRATPRGALAYVIALDQLSRNMFRGEARSFASDARALEAARDAVAQGFDAALPPTERPFLYMPLMHSESLEDQERCVALFRALGSEGQLRFAEQHRDIVARFGRFPHRNAILGRDSTPAELEFLTQPGSSF